MPDCDQPSAKPFFREWSRSTRWQLLGLAVGQVVLVPLAEWLAWQDSFLHHIGLWLSFGLPLVLFGAIIALPTALFGFCFNHNRRNSRCLLACALIGIPSFVFGLILSQPIKRKALEHVMARAEPLIAAIRLYQDANGWPPEHLSALVPGQLTAIPTPGIGVTTEFRYHRPSPDDGSDGNQWWLTVRPPVASVGFNTFIYLPNQNYPKRGWGGVLERIGTWAYVHE